MRIGFQMLSLSPGRLGGAEGYAARLVASVIPRLDDDRLVLFLRPEAAAQSFWRARAADPRVELVVHDPRPQYGPGYAAWSARLLEASRLNVVFFPFSFFFPRPLPIPVAFHLGDIQHEYFPEHFPPAELAWRRERIPESAALADAVVTDSEFSATCIRERYGCDGRVRVIPLAGLLESEIEAAERRPAPADDAPFVLYPAVDWPHKNHDTLLRAFALLAQRRRPERLVLTGVPDPGASPLARRIDALSLGGRVRLLGRVETSELIALYRAATLLAFPSRFEGFGHPLVEAMQLGCPAVISEAGALLETAGGAALRCPDDPRAWADAIERVCDDPALRADLRRRGFARAAAFGWDHCAAAHLALLRELGGGRAAPAAARIAGPRVAGAARESAAR